MRILYIADEKRMRMGAHQFNNFLVRTLRRAGHTVDTLYPPESVPLFSGNLKGINTILWFHSLLRSREDVRRYDVIQGTTFTTLAFLDSGVPVVSHFGSTVHGFLKSVPSMSGLARERVALTRIYRELREKGVIECLNPPLKSLKDVSEVETGVAKKSDLVVVSSEGVRRELVERGVPADKILVVHNAIEDFWFRSRIVRTAKPRAELVYLGRMGEDAFTIKLKGVNRLIHVLDQFPQLHKVVIGMSEKAEYLRGIFAGIQNTRPHFNLRKKLITRILRRHYGDLYLNTGRYEGFCLSLIEAMSQGLVPITFPIGVAPEIIRNGQNGYLVRDLGEMVRRITYLQGRSSLRARMAERAIETALQFRPERIAQDYLTIYRRLHRRRVVRDTAAIARHLWDTFLRRGAERPFTDVYS